MLLLYFFFSQKILHNINTGNNKSTMTNNKKKTLKSSTNKKSNQTTMNLNQQSYDSLRRLSQVLSELDETGRSSNGLISSETSIENDHCSIHAEKQNVTLPNEDLGISIKYWKTIPEDVTQAYQMMKDGSELIKATSTKYTLLGKINVEDGSQMCNDLRKGCEWIATAALIIHQPSAGCGRSTRQYVKQSSRAVVLSVMSLIEAFLSLKALDGNVGAQKTGVVWSACDNILNKMPKGNKICMRRELFTWLGDCNETFQEFQIMIDQSIEKVKEDANIAENSESQTNNDISDDEDLQDDDLYSEREIPTAQALLAIFKCSRGLLNLTMKASDCAGEVVERDESSNNNESKSDIPNDTTVRKQCILQWISNLHEMARIVGEGVTDLGTLLYPPLAIGVVSENGILPLWKNTKLGKQTIVQTDAMLKIAHYIHDAIPPGDHQEPLVMSEEVMEMSSKLLSALDIRINEVDLEMKNLFEMKNSK